MGVNREKGGMEGSLVELEEEDESCRHTIKNSRFKLFAQKNSNITLFLQKKFKTHLLQVLTWIIEKY